MAFWGVDVKPGKPFKHLPNGGKGRLHVSQATLGIGSATNKSIVQCNVGNKIPVFLCSLFPEKSESSQLNLEFDEADEVVFSVLGPRSVHITGFYLGNSRSSRIDDESESYGEDIRDSISDRSEDDDEYDDSFINDDDPGVLSPSPCSTDEEEKPISKPRKSRRLKKKYQVSDSDSQSGDSLQLQNDVNDNGEVEEKEEEASDSEEAVGCFFKSLDKKKPSTTSKDSKEQVDGPLSATNKQESVDPAANAKNKKKRKAREGEETKNKVQNPDEENEQDQSPPSNKIISNEPEIDTAAEESYTKKKKKKKNKNKNKSKKLKTEVMENDMDVDIAADKKIGSEENGDGGSTEARALPNGLIIEEIELGNPDGKVAAPGKKVSVHFTGKIKGNGKVVDSNVGEEPLKFRLGSGEVMGGFDDGIEGMLVGGKRRVTIPPALRKGSSRLKGKKIGSKASLVYEIEVIRIR